MEGEKICINPPITGGQKVACSFSTASGGRIFLEKLQATVTHLRNRTSTKRTSAFIGECKIDGKSLTWKRKGRRIIQRKVVSLIIFCSHKFVAKYLFLEEDCLLGCCGV
jgi:hypothetical protein